MIWLPVTSFICAALIAVASSVWIPPMVQLGKAFWILTLVVTVVPFVFPLSFLLTPADPYGYSFLAFFPALLFFGPVAAGWLVGVGAVVLIRLVRMRRGPAL
jgi:hypothetical protein